MFRPGLTRSYVTTDHENFDVEYVDDLTGSFCTKRFDRN